MKHIQAWCVCFLHLQLYQWKVLISTGCWSVFYIIPSAAVSGQLWWKVVVWEKLNSFSVKLCKQRLNLEDKWYILCKCIFIHSLHSHWSALHSEAQFLVMDMCSCECFPCMFKCLFVLHFHTFETLTMEKSPICAGKCLF